jgi:hypothetical protein
MHPPKYYREQSQRSRRLAWMVHQSDVRRDLLKAAQNFDEIAQYIEAGALEVGHPEQTSAPDKPHRAATKSTGRDQGKF